MAYLILFLFFMFILFIFLMIILDLLAIQFEWRTIKGFRNSMNILVSLFATYVVFLALLAFTFAFTLIRVDRFLELNAEINPIFLTLTLLQSKPFFEHLTYFAALASFYSYLDNNYMKLKNLNLKSSKAEDKKIKINKKISAIKVDIRLRKLLQNYYEENPKGTRLLEEPTKYEVNKEYIYKSEMAVSKLEFTKIGRKKGQFLSGDIVITDDNRLHKIDDDLSAKKAKELLKTNSIKAFYPVESSIEFK